MEINSGDLLTLAREKGLPVIGSSYHFSNTAQNKLHLVDPTPEEQAIADALAGGFEQMPLTANGTLVQATAGVGEVEIEFKVWGSDGILDFQETVGVSGGHAEYLLNSALADAYKVRAYGTTSHESNFVEVVVS